MTASRCNTIEAAGPSDRPWSSRFGTSFSFWGFSSIEIGGHHHSVSPGPRQQAASVPRGSVYALSTRRFCSWIFRAGVFVNGRFAEKKFSFVESNSCRASYIAATLQWVDLIGATSILRNPVNAKLRNPHESAYSSVSSQGEIMKSRFAVLLLTIVALTATSAMAGSKNPVVGGQAMYPTKDIIDNAVNSADHTTLVAAVKAAGLVDTLKGAGPFTVFAPTNEAFAKLPAGAVQNLLKPENKDALTKVLTYHVVAGRLSAADLRKQIQAGNGHAELKTVSGGTLMVMMQGKNIVLKDEKGGISTVTIPNVFQSNGVIHVVDTVVLPN